MNKNSCPTSLTAEASENGAAQPAAQASTKDDACVLMVPTCDNPSELAGFCEALTCSLADKPAGRLTLRFIGPHQMNPDAALIIYDFLTRHRHGATIVTDAWSPLMGSSILVWLAGDVRRVRATTNFTFLSLAAMKRRKAFPFPWDDEPEPAEVEGEPPVDLGLVDYQTLLGLMDQYLPVEQFGGKVITPAMLKEMGLLENSPLDAFIQKFTAA